MLGEADGRSSPVAPFTARVLDGSGDVVGAGFLVGPGQVASCAHVVSAVLGGSPEDATAPAGRLRVDLPLLATPHESEATVRTWRPVAPDSGFGDVAILELATPPPADGGAQLPPLYRPDQLWGHRFRVLGFPAGMQDGVWAGGELRDRQGTRWLQLQGDPHGPAVAHGFSGAPVWDETVEAVVGMTVASDLRPGSTTAYLIPIEDVFDVDPRLLPSPYRGLEPFGEEHADVFHGRSDEVEKLVALVDRQAVVAVVGRSGTGKSSLVRAGLLPRLRRRGTRVVELRTWPADPSPDAALDRLAAELGPGSGLGLGEPSGDVVVFADQFEELVGTTPAGKSPTPAQEVLHRLLGFVRSAPPKPDGGGPSLRLVLTLRWEAMNELLTDDVVETFDHGTLSLAPMRRDQLRDAVVGPAARAPGLRFDDGLVERILDDAVGEPGQLPLVESLLAHLWETRQGATLRTAAYEQAGGVKGAVARHAEQVVAALAGTDPAADTGVDTGAGADADGRIRRLFTSLARPDDATGFVRRSARLERLPFDQQALVEPLARHRLLVVGQEPDGSHTVELAHQALIDHWPRLRQWLDDDRDFLQWRHEVDGHRQGWERSGLDPGALLRGVALARAEEWLGRRSHDVPAADRAYVDASRQRTRREARRRRALLSGLGIVLTMALLLGSLLVYQRRVTDREQADSDARALATLSADTAPTNPALAIDLALAAYARSPTPEAENALFRQYVAYRTTDTVLSGVEGSIVQVDASSDGRLVAARALNSTATTWQRRPGQPVEVRHLSSGQILALDVGDDGESILVAARGEVHVEDAVTGRTLWEIPVAGEDVRSMVLGKDGFVALRLGEVRGQDPGSLEVWAPDGDGGGRRTGGVAFDAEFPLDTILGFDPTRDAVVVEDNPTDVNAPSTIVSWDIVTGAVATIADGAEALGNTLSADGVLVMCHFGGTAPSGEVSVSVSRLDLRDDAENTVSLPPGESCSFNGPVVDAGATMMSAEFGVVVDLRTGEAFGQARVPAEEAPLYGPLVSEGDRLLTLHADDNAILMSEVPTDGRAVPAERVRPTADPTLSLTDLPQVHTVRMLPDGEHLLGVSGGGARLFVARADGHNEVVASVDRPAPPLPPSRPAGPPFNADGTLLADRVAPDTIQVRRLPGLELVSEVTVATSTPAVNEDGEAANLVHWSFDRLFTYDGPLVQWWDPASGELVAELDLRDTGLVGDDAEAGSFFLASYADRDHVLLSVVGDPESHILEVATGREVGVLPFGDDVLATQFQPDTRYVAVLHQGDSVEVWDRIEARRVLGPFPSVGGLNNTAGDVIVQFLPEPGAYLLGDREQLRWYEAGEAAPTRRLDLGTDRPPVAASQDGSVVLYLDDRLESVVMPPLQIDPAVWRRTLCDLVDDRAFSPEEHAQLPSGTTRHPCP